MPSQSPGNSYFGETAPTVLLLSPKGWSVPLVSWGQLCPLPASRSKGLHAVQALLSSS